MATLSPYNLQTKLIKLVSSLVGTRLSQSPAQTGTKPSVIMSNGYDTATQAPINEPQFPYIAVDYINSRRWGDADVKNQYMKDGIETQETDVILYYDIKCYGLAKNDCGSIMDELARRLELSSTRNFIQTEMLANLFRTDDVRKFTVKRQTNFVDVYRLQIQLIQTSSLEDTSLDVFDTIVIDTAESEGGLEHFPEDTSPLPIFIEAP
jgi:hypothetical protein